VLVAATLILPACSSAAPSDDGPAELTLWVRAANEAKTRALADAYNASHEDQVTVTAFPDDQFVTRVGTSKASGEVPDLLATDAVYMPTFLDQGIYLDITDRIEESDFAGDLFPALLEASTDAEGRMYAVPRDPGTSLLFWNKDLFAQAGLDPEVAPSTWEDVATAAAAIDALEGDASGYYLAGNCSGCNAFTYLPMVWAAGGEVINEDGATFEDPANVSGLEFLNKLWEQGSIPEGARSDGGENWLTGFMAGTVGIQPLGSFAIAAINADAPELNYGVAPLPGNGGETASFIGGDVLGIPAESENANAAWEFIDWTLSDEVQLDIVAKSGELVSRTDLVDNEFSNADPNVIAANEALAVGRVPLSVYYPQLIQDPNGPFLLMLQSAIFDGNPDAAETAQASADEIVAADQ
jgi:multiple sugar transport system substrate-binding protein